RQLTRRARSRTHSLLLPRGFQFFRPERLANIKFRLAQRCNITGVLAQGLSFYKLIVQGFSFPDVLLVQSIGYCGVLAQGFVLYGEHGGINSLIISFLMNAWICPAGFQSLCKGLAQPLLKIDFSKAVMLTLVRPLLKIDFSRAVMLR